MRKIKSVNLAMGGVVSMHFCPKTKTRKPTGGLWKEITIYGTFCKKCGKLIVLDLKELLNETKQD